jgi:hypothetical protein
MEVESVRGGERAQPRGQVLHRLVGRETHDFRHVGMLADEGRHRLLGDAYQLRVGMAPGEGPDERGGQQDVANRAEADEENAQHAANVSLALPGFASRV